MRARNCCALVTDFAQNLREFLKPKILNYKHINYEHQQGAHKTLCVSVALVKWFQSNIIKNKSLLSPLASHSGLSHVTSSGQTGTHVSAPRMLIGPLPLWRQQMITKPFFFFAFLAFKLDAETFRLLDPAIKLFDSTTGLTLLLHSPSRTPAGGHKAAVNTPTGENKMTESTAGRNQNWISALL